jgi:hypothetical protein
MVDGIQRIYDGGYVPRGESDNSKSEQVKHCMDLEHCRHWLHLEPTSPTVLHWLHLELTHPCPYSAQHHYCYPRTLPLEQMMFRRKRVAILYSHWNAVAPSVSPPPSHRQNVQPTPPLVDGISVEKATTASQSESNNVLN